MQNKTNGKQNQKVEEQTNEKHVRPTYKGTLQDEERNIVANIALWETEPETEKYPVLTGNVQFDGKKYRVALWQQ